MYSTDPISSAATVAYASRGRRLTIEYESAAVSGYWGVWVNTGGWGGHRQFSVQPTTGRFDQIGQSIGDDSAGRIEAAGRCEWAVRWTVGPVTAE